MKVTFSTLKKWFTFMHWGRGFPCMPQTHGDQSTACQTTWVEGTISTHVISLDDGRLYPLSQYTSLCFLNRQSYSSLGWPETCYVAQFDSCLCTHMSAHGSQKRALHSVELVTVVSYPVGAGNQA